MTSISVDKPNSLENSKQCSPVAEPANPANIHTTNARVATTLSMVDTWR